MDARLKLKVMYGVTTVMSIALLYVVASVYVGPILFGPPQPCPNYAVDHDCDGLQDSKEESGFTSLLDSKWYKKCEGNEPLGSQARADCVALNSPDLFVIVQRHAEGSLIENSLNLFSTFSKNTEQGGLGIAVHPVDQPYSVPYPPPLPDRRVVDGSGQNAALVVEYKGQRNFDSGCRRLPGDAPFGSTDPAWGSPNYQDITSTIYPSNIAALIDSHCQSISGVCRNASEDTGGTGECDMDGNQVDPDELDDLDRSYIRHTTVHELGHQIMLTGKFSRKHGGYHHPGESNLVMEQYNKIDTGTDVVFHIPESFDDGCQNDFQLW